MAEINNQDYRQIRISNDDLKSGDTSSDIIQAAFEDFHANGFVILENALPHSILDKLSIQMQADRRTQLGDTDLLFNNSSKNRSFSVTPPLSSEWLHEEIYANRHAIAVLENIIGPKPQLTHMTSAILLQSRKGNREAVHIDTFVRPHSFPLCIEVSIALEDVSSENGAPELWPGSHKSWDSNELCKNGRGWVKESAFKKRAEIAPPCQPSIPKGAICLRDVRVWHAGMPNFSPHPRIILRLLYSPRWFRSPMRVTLPEECKDLLGGWKHVDLLTATDFVDGASEIEGQVGSEVLTDLNSTLPSRNDVLSSPAAIDFEKGEEETANLEVMERDYWVPPKEEQKSRFTEEMDVCAPSDFFAQCDSSFQGVPPATCECAKSPSKQLGRNRRKRIGERATRLL